jgi:cysteine sulfinate desulfinase/cysteine desulfurase-like protein
MLPYLREHFGNPSSVHRFGVRAHEAVDRARGAVRLSVGRFTREGDVDRAAELLVERAAALQR